MNDGGPVAGDDDPPGAALLADVDRKVAAAADAWLTDPRDVDVYRRLVEAVTLRRRQLERLAASAGRNAPVGAEPAQGEPEERGIEERDVPAVPAVGEFLGGDPRAVLDRLRRGG